MTLLSRLSPFRLLDNGLRSMARRMAQEMFEEQSYLRSSFEAGNYKSDEGDQIAGLQAARAEIYPNLSKYQDQLEVYSQSSWVYAAVDMKATAGALTAINVLQRRGEKTEGIKNHPLEILLRHPNKLETQFEFMYSTLATLELSGNCYWFLNGVPGAPQELQVLPPSQMRIAPGKTSDNPIDHYVYTVDGAEVEIPAENIAHFTLFNPRSKYYGMSRLEAGLLALRTDMSMQSWNYNFFGRDKAVPAGVWILKGYPDDTQYKKTREDILRHFGGQRRTTAIIRGDEMDYIEMGLAHTDLDFLAGRQFTKEEIFLLYGIPVGLTDKNSTEANALAAMDLFINNTVWPMMIRLSQKIELRVAPYFGDDLAVEPDDIRRTDATARLAEIRAASEALTINEIRTEYWHKPERPDGDIYAAGAGAAAIVGQRMPFGAIPAQISAPQVDQQEGQRQAVIDAMRKSLPEPQKAGPGRLFNEAELYMRGKQALANPYVALQKDPGYARSGFILLSLENNEDLTVLQSTLKAANPDTFINWILPQDFHATLLYADAMNDLQFANLMAVLPRQMGNLHVHATGLSTFPVDEGAAQPLIMQVEKTPELAAFQAGLVASAKALGIELSPYSEDWKPHITLGYLSPGMPVPDGTGLELNTLANIVKLSAELNQDDYQILHTSKIVLPVIYSHAMLKELDQFHKFALAHGKDPDGFTFKPIQPRSVIIAAKAMADLGDRSDLHEHNLMTLKMDIRPASRRVSVSGIRDPLAKEKEARARAMQSEVAGYLTDLKGKVVAGIRHVNAANRASKADIAGSLQNFLAYFDKSWWEGHLARLAAILKAQIHDATSTAADETYKNLYMQLGMDLDPSGFNAEAAQYALDWTDKILKGLGTTTSDGLGAILGRWIGSPGSTLEDLIGAVQESGLFSGDRAALVAETETTRAFNVGTYITAQEYAQVAKVNLASTQDQTENLIPAHPACRCWTVVKFIYDDHDNITGVDMTYHTANDDQVCKVCGPRNGKLVSSLVGEAA